MQTPLLDATGRRRSPAPMPGYHQRSPRNKGLRYRAAASQPMRALMTRCVRTPTGASTTRWPPHALPLTASKYAPASIGSPAW